MDSKTQRTIFQTVLLVIFGLAVVAAIGLFAANKGGTSTKPGQLAGTVTVWGTLPYQTMKTTFDSLQVAQKDLRIQYTEKSPETFESSLVDALASGTGPDIFMVTPETVLRHKPRLTIIPYTSFPQKLFQETYVNQASLFALPEGVVAFPMFLDPLMMYVNRDVLTASYIVSPPKTWTELSNMNQSLTKVTETGTILQSMVGLGTFDNVTHASEIIKTLAFQTGDPITVISLGATDITTTQGNEKSNNTPAVFDFYTSFANKQNTNYSWNIGQRNDREQFIAGKSAFYFGNASELPVIREKNPNLNFDIVMVPRPESGGTQTVYAHMVGWGISKLSKNQALSIGVLQLMADKNFISQVLNGTWYAPARRDMLTTLPAEDAIRSLVYKAAIVSQSFWNPDERTVDQTLRKSITQVNNGSIQSFQAYQDWINEINVQLREKQPKK